MTDTIIRKANFAQIQASPLEAVVHDAARKLLTLRLTNIRGNYADKSDAQALRDDLEVLCQIVDPVILAIGHYAREHFGSGAFTDKIIRECFTDQLLGALDGNAMFHLVEAGDAAQAELYDNECSDSSEHDTLLRRSAQGA